MSIEHAAPQGLVTNGAVYIQQQSTITAAHVHDALRLFLDGGFVEEWADYLQKRSPAMATEDLSAESDVQCTVQMPFRAATRQSGMVSRIATEQGGYLPKGRQITQGVEELRRYFKGRTAFRSENYGTADLLSPALLTQQDRRDPGCFAKRLQDLLVAISSSGCDQRHDKVSLMTLVEEGRYQRTA